MKKQSLFQGKLGLQVRVTICNLKNHDYFYSLSISEFIHILLNKAKLVSDDVEVLNS